MFGKIKQEDVIAYIKGLSDEDKAKLFDELKPAETTKEEVAEAKEDIENKGEDEQSEKDRIDESVAEQEKEEDNEDSQDAKDRVDESEGEEEAIENAKEEVDKSEDVPEWAKSLIEDIKELKGKFASGEDSEVEEQANETYGLGHGVFQGNEEAGESKKMDVSTIRSIIKNLK